MTRPFPILHVDRLGEEDRRGEMSVAEIAALGRRLEASDFRTPPPPLLAAGWLGAETAHPTGLVMTRERRLEPLAYWCANVGARGFTSLLAASADELFGGEGIGASDLPILTGHGIVVASRGVEGRPLVGLEVAELRRELEVSRRRLSAACGYEVRVLAPAPTVAGRVYDGLVEREARRAGYALLLEPGGLAEIDGPRSGSIVEYRTRERGETPTALCDWLLGRRRSRARARVRRLASAPRAVWDRFASNFEV